MENSNRFEYEKLVRNILRDIRGPRSQEFMSQQLGFSFNQWHKWESGQKGLMWSEIVQISKFENLSLSSPMEHILMQSVSVDHGGEFLKKLLTKFTNFDMQKIEEKIGISKSTLYRLIEKENLEVAIIFQALGEFSSMLPHFLSFFSTSFSDKKLNQVITQNSNHVSLHGAQPWLSVIEVALKTHEYKSLKEHDSSVIAKKTGLNDKKIQEGLKILEKFGAIIKEDNKYTNTIQRVDMEGDISSSAQFAKFWTEMAAQRFNTPDGIPRSGRGWSSRVYPTSREASEQIRKLYFKFNAALSAIILEDYERKKEHIQVVVVQKYNCSETVLD